MPGIVLSFNCPCGFRKDGVWVGATETGHHMVVICLECKRIFSIWVPASRPHLNRERKSCNKCGKELMFITDLGAWIPSSLQKKFIDFEPWMVEDRSAGDIRILCPKCRTYSLQYEKTSLWD